MNELQTKLVDMLEWFHTFCEDNKIRYYLVCGTMLGAVRHNGIIPWDDDIDVAMPRPDYERLRNLCSQCRSGKYVIEYPDRKVGEYPYLSAKVYDTQTTLIEKYRKPVKRGIYIDIFPLDGVGNDYNTALKEFKRLQKKLTLNSMISCAMLPRRKWHKNVAIALGRIISPLFVNKKRLVDKIERMCQEYSYHDSVYVANITCGFGARGIVKKEWFGEPKLYEFEKLKVYGMEDPDSYLTAIYGDYMQPPPEDKRVSVHDYELLDLNKSYLEE